MFASKQRGIADLCMNLWIDMQVASWSLAEQQLGEGLMNWRSLGTLISLAVFLAVLLAGTPLGAQTQKKSVRPKRAVSHPLVCRAGQLRCATNKHRMAAAARAADRRAAQLTRQQGHGR